MLRQLNKFKNIGSTLAGILARLTSSYQTPVTFNKILSIHLVVAPTE